MASGILATTSWLLRVGPYPADPARNLLGGRCSRGMCGVVRHEFGLLPSTPTHRTSTTLGVPRKSTFASTRAVVPVLRRGKVPDRLTRLIELDLGRQRRTHGAFSRPMHCIRQRWRLASFHCPRPPDTSTRQLLVVPRAVPRYGWPVPDRSQPAAVQVRLTLRPNGLESAIPEPGAFNAFTPALNLRG